MYRVLQIHTRQYDGLRSKLCMAKRSLIDNDSDFIHYTMTMTLYYKVYVIKSLSLSIKPRLPMQSLPRNSSYCLEKYSTIAPKYQQHNVGGLHELQRRELYEWYFAVRHDCGWQYWKFIVWGDLYNHKESPDSRKSVIWHRQSNSELASAGESGQTLTR
ncbi:hypothetical protein ALC57_13190 [Trachymyrmex cornetzi]|uniref:Uncharacterized protein n=1 Tax=Trachymyrmex cornetzi TaxID=471704 RepID=A0A151J068_9HYME|nr:hypothetical protein ALC57_13190 [Trachymyrmex cornetzi]